MQEFLAFDRYSFTRNAVDRAPASPGLYGLFEGPELIYIGCTAEEPGRTLRDCLIGHLDGLHGRCTASATRYCWEITISSASRSQELRGRFEAIHHRQPRCQRTDNKKSGKRARRCALRAGGASPRERRTSPGDGSVPRT